MKRIIHMERDVYPGLLGAPDAPKMFAVWCTVNDRFHEIDGNQDWSSADELEAAFNNQIAGYRSLTPGLVLSAESIHKKIEDTEKLRDRCVSLARGNGY